MEQLLHSCGQHSDIDTFSLHDNSTHTWTDTHFLAMGCRKVRVGRDSYQQSGRAGDLSIRTGAAPRVEDESAYRQHTIDSPSFVRFCNSLPKLPEQGPNYRHHAAMQRHDAAMQQTAADDVARLDAWDVMQQERAAVVAAQQAAAAVSAGKKK